MSYLRAPSFWLYHFISTLLIILLYLFWLDIFIQVHIGNKYKKSILTILKPILKIIFFDWYDSLQKELWVDG